VASFKPAYQIHGDDHGRLAERRAKLRALAEADSGAGAVEVLEGDACTPDAVHAALTAMTFAMGRRFVIADGVERWTEGDVAVVAPILADPGEELTAAFFAREEGRLKAPAKLHDAVEKAGGAIDAVNSVKGKDLPKWCVEQGRALGLELDVPAARALVQRVGDRQQRLLRELEKLALELGPGASLTADDVEAMAAGSAERKTWALADALVARDRPAALALFLELREQGERIPSLGYQMTRRLRDALEVATRLEAGESAADVRRSLRMPSWAASQLISQVQHTEVDDLRRAIERLADLEVDTRGGRTPRASLSEDTAALRAIAAIAG
jgi:DNA polymerase-3 subunit delta